MQVPQNSPDSIEYPLQREEWRPVVGYDGFYEVSSLGRIKSRVGVGCKNNYSLDNNWKFKKTSSDKLGRKTVMFSMKRKHKRKFVHRVMMEAFHGPSDLYVCHNNGNHLDNRIENLRYDTQQGNMDDKKKHGTYQYGEMCHTAKLKENQAKDIIKTLKNKKAKIRDLAKEYKVHYNTVKRILVGETWKHLQGNPSLLRGVQW